MQLENIKERNELLGNSGKTLELTDDVIKDVIRFVCNYKKCYTLSESHVAI